MLPSFSDHNFGGQECNVTWLCADHRRKRGWVTPMTVLFGHTNFLLDLTYRPQNNPPVLLIILNTHMGTKKILLPSAVHLEERLTVSQSVPEPASRQSVRYTQFGFFVSGRCRPQAAGRSFAATQAVVEW